MLLNENLIHRIILDEINENVRFNPTKAHVYNTFEEIDNKFFNGTLPMCNIEIIQDRMYLGYFHYSNIINGKLINPTISINGNYQYTIKEFESVVAHEMIHYYLAYNGYDLQCEHGTQFNSLANQINSALGLQVSETVDVSQMGYGQQQQMVISTELLGYMNSYAKSFQEYLPQIKQEGSQMQGKIAQFYTTLYEFTQNLVNALNRCVKKKTINETTLYQLAQKVLPFEPIHSYINGFQDWYNKTNRWLNGRNFDGTPNSYENSSGNSLITLLFKKYPNIKKQYQQLSMNIQSQTLENEFKNIDDLKQRITYELNNRNKNAQAQQS